jgi:tripartite-type tricarboxylate transporter receptor subunit TctC
MKQLPFARAVRVTRCAIGIAAIACLYNGSAFAQTFPTKAVRIMVPVATGGGSDTVARHIAAGLGKVWGQGVVVENRAGASGTIGTMEVVRAAPDGYTLIVENSSMVSNFAVQGKLPYDYAKDLTGIALLGVNPLVLVAHPSANIGSIRELVAATKAKPDGFTYASCGIGTPQHFAMERLKQMTGMKIAHAGYKGCAPAITDVLGGQVPLGLVSANLAVPYINSGRLRALGVTTSMRYRMLPQTPTFEEQGFKPFNQANWSALMGPANMPPEVVAKIAADVERVLADPVVRTGLSSAGIEVLLKGTGEQVTRMIRDDAERFMELAKSANIKAE